jgi:hypothetical protein
MLAAPRAQSIRETEEGPNPDFWVIIPSNGSTHPLVSGRFGFNKCRGSVTLCSAERGPSARHPPEHHSCPPPKSSGAWNIFEVAELLCSGSHGDCDSTPTYRQCILQ